MSVKRKGQQPNYAGIVVTGATQEQAVTAYAKVAKGENVQVLSDSNSSMMLATTAGASQFYNPLSSDKEIMQTVDRDLEVTANTGEDELVSVAYAICTDGCGTHIIADDPESVANCPECCASVDFTLDFDDEDDLESDSSTYSDQGFIVAASSASEAAAQVQDLLQDPSTALSFTSASGVSFIAHCDSDICFDPLNAEPVEGEPLGSEASADLEAKASNIDPVAHYFQCFSDDCGSHIISQSADTTFCPVCESAVMDPEDMAELEQHMTNLESDSSDDLEDDDLLDDDLEDLDDLEDTEVDLLDDEDIDLESDSSYDLEDDEFEIVASGSDCDDEDDDLDEDDDDDIEGLEDEEDEDDLESDSSYDLDTFEDIDLESDSSYDLDTFEDIDLESDSSYDLEDDEFEIVASSDDLEDNSTLAEVSNIDAMTVVANTTEGGLNSEEIALINCSSVAGQARWIAFHGDNVIAMASESNVEGAAKQIFGTPAFAQATLKAIANTNVEQGLADFGFKSISYDADTIQVAVSNELINEAQAKVDSFEQAQAQRDSVLLERLSSALATSLMGINRGVFVGRHNPIIASLSSKLKASGLANAEDLVHASFAEESDKFNKIISDKVAELLSKSSESQDEIAQMVASSTYARTNMESNSSVSTSVEERLVPRSIETKQSSQITSESSNKLNDDFQSKTASLMKTMFG